MPRSQPAFPLFAADAKFGDGRTYSVRDEAAVKRVVAQVFLRERVTFPKHELNSADSSFCIGCPDQKFT